VTEYWVPKHLRTLPSRRSTLERNQCPTGRTRQGRIRSGR
jgi:hypothetical protein